MAVSLKAKLSAAFAALAVGATLISAALVDRNVARKTMAGFADRLSYETTMLGQMTANALFGEIDPSDTSLKESVRALGAAVHTQLSVIAKNGTVVADSETDDTQGLGSQSHAAEIVSAQTSGVGTAVRDGRLFVAAAIVRDGAMLGFARSAVSMNEVSAELTGVRLRMAAGSLLAMVVATMAGFIFSSALVRPIRALARGARRVGAGDFEHAIAVSTSDEIGELAVAFNEMTRNLRKTVAELDGRNRDMRLVLDNVDQGLLTLDLGGVMAAERSAIVTRWFGPSSVGDRFADCIRRVDPQGAELFELHWEGLVEGFLPLSMLLYQLPKRLVGPDRSYQLSYIPITGSDARLAKVLVVITDITARLAAQRAEGEQREVAAMVERIMRDRSGVLEFFAEADVLVQELTRTKRGDLAELGRKLHTLKGNSAMYGLLGLAALCHEIETGMAESQGELTDANRDALRNAWAQTTRRMSSFLGERNMGIHIDEAEYASIMRAVFDGIPQTEVLAEMRRWKLDRASERLERFAVQARELGARLHKGDIDVHVDGGGLRLPRQEWAAFWSTFTHVVRNAVDHGIEVSADRIAAGKNSRGQIRLSAIRTGRAIQIELSDDGRGIDWKRLAAKARAASLPANDHQDLVAALFADGISTTDTTSDTSGRGIGLSAAKQACEQLGGTVAVESRSGEGTSFRFSIPFSEPWTSLLPVEPAPSKLAIGVAQPH